jgi:hypothetical protein
VKAVTVQNDSGQTIEVKRGGKAGEIDIRHTRIHPTDFGRYYEADERLRYPPIASFLAKRGLELTANGDAGAYAVIGRSLCLLDKAEVAMIREAIKKLE